MSAEDFDLVAHVREAGLRPSMAASAWALGEFHARQAAREHGESAVRDARDRAGERVAWECAVLEAMSFAEVMAVRADIEPGEPSSLGYLGPVWGAWARASSEWLLDRWDVPVGAGRRYLQRRLHEAPPEARWDYAHGALPLQWDLRIIDPLRSEGQ